MRSFPKLGLLSLVWLLATTTMATAASPEAPIATSINAFGIDAYKAICAEAEGDNVFFSPASISTALAMTMAGAKGKTAEEMATTLHLPKDDPSVHEGFAAFMGKVFAPTAGMELSVANKIWPHTKLKILESFVATLEKSYQAAVTTLDYGKSEAARKTINDWVATQTKGKILDLIPQGLITPATRLVLTNAIYFKGKWSTAFDKGATAEAPFTLQSGGKVQAEMMHRPTKKTPYFEDPTLQAVALPYKGDAVSMVVLLPKTTDGLAGLEESLTTDKLGTILGGLFETDVVVSMPKFETTSFFSLKKILVALGMKTPFEGGNANFYGITKDEPLAISEVLHKAFVGVDEEGTEAAAATAVVMMKGTAAVPAPPKVFTADHPFVYLIVHDLTKSVLFMGRVMDPTK